MKEGFGGTTVHTINNYLKINLQEKAGIERRAK
jgi:hypothetical protein